MLTCLKSATQTIEFERHPAFHVFFFLFFFWFFIVSSFFTHSLSIVNELPKQHTFIHT